MDNIRPNQEAVHFPEDSIQAIEQRKVIVGAACFDVMQSQDPIEA